MRFIYSKIFAVFAVLVLLTAVLLFAQNRGWLGVARMALLGAPRPVVVITKSGVGSVKTFFSTVYGLKQIVHDNNDLKNQVRDLQRQLADLDLEKRENETLRQELGFAAKSPFALVPCTVLSQNPSGFTDSLVLNCGTNEGVEVGLAVISKGYLVAKIIYADSRSSTALLATSSKFLADAELTKTGADAVVDGSFGSGLLLDRLAQNSEIQKGWMVVTAGINRQIPKGILIGQVDETISSQNDLFKRATLLSPVDFSDLDFVFVVKP